MLEKKENKPKIKDGKTRCEICKKWFINLSRHIPSHGIKVDDYRGMFGYSFGTQLNADKPKGNRNSYKQYGAYNKRLNYEKRLYQIAKDTDIFETEDS